MIRTRFAWLLLILGCLLLLGVIGMAFARRNVPIPDLQDSEPWLSGIFNAIGAFSLLLTGGYLALRLPHNILAWTMLAAGFGYANHLFAVAYTYTSYLVVAEPLPLTALMFVLAAVGISVQLPAVPLIVLLFPTGKLPSPRWRIAYGVCAFSVVVFSFAWLSPAGRFVPFENPLAQAGNFSLVMNILTTTAWFSILFLMSASAISAVVRGLRAKGQERQQFKWLALAILLYLVSLLWLNASGVLAYFAKTLALASIPLAIAIAVVRYRLWDLDVVIRRTTQYVLLTGILALVYFGSIVVLQQLITPFTGESDVAVVLSTLLIAGLFLPLRRKIQGIIDRRFFRRKYDAEKVLAQFAATARDETDLDALTAELLRVIQETMEPEHVSLWLKSTADR